VHFNIARPRKNRHVILDITTLRLERTVSITFGQFNPQKVRADYNSHTYSRAHYVQPNMSFHDPPNLTKIPPELQQQILVYTFDDPMHQDIVYRIIYSFPRVDGAVFTIGQTPLPHVHKHALQLNLIHSKLF
jgi:hypothetical protein